MPLPEKLKSRIKKAQPEQAFLKIGVYGTQGSGKTATSLLVGEWLAAQDNARFKTKKRVLAIDTERGMDFYSRDVDERRFHPKAFDFDRIVTRSISEAKELVQSIKADPSEYAVVILDSVTHLWEACKEAWSGGLTSAGTFPKQAWGPIKRPWKALMEAGLNGEFHFIICGREGLIFEKDEDTGEDSMTGYKMKAEGEAGYEPHQLVQMYQYRTTKHKHTCPSTCTDLHSEVRMFVEKDRSGCLTGKTIPEPKADVFAPLYALLGGQQGTFTESADAASIDAKAAVDERETEAQNVVATYEAIRKAIMDARDKTALKAAWELTKGKKKLLGDRFEALSAIVDGRLAELNEAAVLSDKAAAKAAPAEKG